jgi:hypothetical protein
MAAGDGHTLAYHMNRLAGTIVNNIPTLDAQGAANVWAGTTGLGIAGAVNVKNGITDRSLFKDLQGALNQRAGTVGFGENEAAARIVS